MPYKDPAQRRLRYWRKCEEIKRQQAIYRANYRANHKAETKRRNIVYQLKHRDKILKQCRQYWRDNIFIIKARQLELKKLVFNVYGGLCCEKCDEDRIEALTLDHINQDGAISRQNGEQRGGIALYRHLRKLNYPPGFRVLCANW